MLCRDALACESTSAWLGVTFVRRGSIVETGARIDRLDGCAEGCRIAPQWVGLHRRVLVCIETDECIQRFATDERAGLTR